MSGIRERQVNVAMGAGRIDDLRQASRPFTATIKRKLGSLRDDRLPCDDAKNSPRVITGLLQIVSVAGAAWVRWLGRNCGSALSPLLVLPRFYSVEPFTKPSLLRPAPVLIVVRIAAAGFHTFAGRLSKAYTRPKTAGNCRRFRRAARSLAQFRRSKPENVIVWAKRRASICLLQREHVSPCV